MRKIKAICLVIVLLFVLEMTSYGSWDDIFSGEWYYGYSSNLSISVEPSANDIFGEINWARRQWNGINSNANFSSCSQGYNGIVKVGIASLDGSYGIAYLYDANGVDNNYGVWRSGRVWIDTDYNTISYLYLKKICVHELGHILGLKDLRNSPAISIMKQGWNNYILPQQYDKDNINLKY